MFSLTKWLKSLEGKRLLRIELERDKIRSEIMQPMTQSQVHNWNVSAIINSAGWIGGDYTEKDIKRRLLNLKSHFFTKPEFDELSKHIESIG